MRLLWSRCSGFLRHSSLMSAFREWSSGAFFSISPEVSRALEDGDAVVALETTILTHGMPHPHNLQTALEVEKVVRSQGAVPASVGVVNGRVHVGLDVSQLKRLAVSLAAEKISQRDFAYSLSEEHDGGTTVAGTLLCAHKAGIPVFITGGLGGVHRDGENTLDISADLVSLGRHPVAVVCAGVKSILDVGKTLEFLETQGVSVLTYGEDKEFPSFFTAHSGHQAPHNVTSPLQAARVINANLEFGVGSGVVIGVPIPAEASCLGNEIERAIQQALSEARNEGVSGKEITPFVLKRVNELTLGQSLTANIALIKNNAIVGSRIAVELAKLRKEITGNIVRPAGIKTQATPPCPVDENKKEQTVVIGASVVDISAKIQASHIMREGTNPGSLNTTFGGVGRNIVECMSRLGAVPLFISAVGKDQNGQLVCGDLESYGVSLRGLNVSSRLPTATYCLVLDHKGEVYCGIGDMNVVEEISVDWVKHFSAEISGASRVCIDANIPRETMKYVLDICSASGVPVWFEPTCIAKCCKPILLDRAHCIDIASPNLQELRSMYSTLTANETSTKTPTELSLEEKLSECMKLVEPVLSSISTVIVSLGKDGVLYNTRRGGLIKEVLHYPAATCNLLPVEVQSVSGAGDSFVGSMLTSFQNGLTTDLSIKAGLNAAYLSLQSMTAISTQLSPQLQNTQHIREWAPWNAREIP